MLTLLLKVIRATAWIILQVVYLILRVVKWVLGR